MAISDLRRQYSLAKLSEEQLTDDPLVLFQRWLDDAIAAQIPDPTAMTVATVNDRGQPSQRIVLLKKVDENGFVFFTNFGSRKAQDLAGNSAVSLHFPWFFMERQVHVQGHAQRIEAAESAAYFASRPKDSQLAAYASRQSQPVASRDILMQEFTQLKQTYADKPLPTPQFWGGYRVVPEQLEFWQGGQDRLHDRFQYRREDGDNWAIQRLMP